MTGVQPLTDGSADATAGDARAEAARRFGFKPSLGRAPSRNQVNALMDLQLVDIVPAWKVLSMPDPHDLALFTVTAGSAVGALLMADAADEALQRVPDVRRRRVARLLPASRVPLWAYPMALHGISLAFLGGMAASGAVLLGAFP